MKLTQEQIDRIHKISDWCIKGILLVGLVVLFLKPGKWFWWVAGISLLVAIVVNTIFAYWATDEEKEQRKNEIKEALREEQEAQAKKKRDYMPPRETPLIDLTEKQEGIVNSLLLDIPVVNGHLKTSELIQILRALAGQGDLDDSDKDELIYWVERVTGKDVDVRNFKYDYDSKYSENGVIKWGNIIRANFDKLENS